MFSILSNHFKRYRRDDDIRVAFVEPHQNPSVRALRTAFINEFTREIPIVHRFKIFDGRGNQQRMAKDAHRALSRKYNAIVSVGLSTNIHLRKAQRWRFRRLPILFADVENPVEVGLLKSASQEKSNFTGVNVERKNFDTHIKKLVKLVPNLSRAMVVCNPKQAIGNIAKKKDDLLTALRKHGIAPYSLGHDNPVTFVFVLIEYIKQLRPDILITLNDEVTQLSWRIILDVCDEMRIPVFAPELDSVEHGFTFGCGISYKDVGTECGRRLVEITKEGIHPSELPLITLKQTDDVWVNNESLRKHNVELDDAARNWVLEHGRIV